MAVVREFALPDLGEGLTEAEIVRWLVEVGEVVTVDQPVVEVETAKAVVEVPCPCGGVVTARHGEEGEEVLVGRPLLTVAVGPVPSGEAEPERGGGSGNVLVGYGTGSAATSRRRRAVLAGRGRFARAGWGGSSVPRSAPGPEHRAVAPFDVPRIGVASGAPAASPGSDSSVAPVASEASVAVISPLVRRMAREHGIDLRGLAGSGPDGLILRADVERAVARAEASAGAGAGAEAGAQSGDEATRAPLRGARGAVAEKLSRSRREIPDATCWVDADATELLVTRAAMNESAGGKVSLLALLARICIAGLARYPELNSTVDTERGEIVQLPGVHLGFAAQTGRGLVVPVVRDAHRRTVAELSAEIARLTESARDGGLTPAELTGGTFTLNNYGVFGVDGSTPIINHPEAAMLGVGRIAPRAWVHGGELAVRQVVQLSFTFDHRVCDGGTAGGFLRFVADCVERPVVLLRNV